MSSLKYEEHLNSLPNCPPSDFLPRTIEAYRMVTANPPCNDCFIPRSFEAPPRGNVLSDIQRCDAYGLSLFASVDGLRARMQEVTGGKKDHKLIQGKKIAVGVIEESDGLCNSLGRQGHFTLHESVGTRLHEKFEVVVDSVL